MLIGVPMADNIYCDSQYLAYPTFYDMSASDIAHSQASHGLRA